MNKKIQKFNKGYSLVEIVFYVAIFTILAIVLINSLITMTGLFMKVMLNRDIVRGSTVVESISRELKQAESFTFASNILTINTRDDSNNAKTIVYSLSGTNISVVDSVAGNLGNLNTPNISVVSFNVSPINTLNSKAAKLNLSIRSNRDMENRVEDFQNTLILRRSY